MDERNAETTPDEHQDISLRSADPQTSPYSLHNGCEKHWSVHY